MDGWTFTAVVPTLGLIGAYLGHRLRLPAGPFVGAMVGVGAALGLLGFPDVSPSPLAGQGLQVMVGVIVGIRITRDSLRSGARALLPAAILAAVFLVSGVVAAIAAVSLTGMTPVTALFAAAPGGLTEMATVGASLGADGPAVAAVHLVRLLLVILAANVLLSRMQRENPEMFAQSAAEDEAADSPVRRDGLLKLGAVIAAGFAGGVVGLVATPLPAGGVVGSLVGAGIVRALVQGAVPERGFSLVVQVLSGGIIGLGLSAEFFETLANLAAAAAMINAVQMLVWVVAGYLLVRVFGFGSRTATFASAPGGMGTLLSITGETDADLVTVAFTHLLRLSATIVVVPVLVEVFFAG
jgi:membrane AbrB-like protein